MLLVDQTDYYTMSPVDVQARLDEFQSSTFDAVAVLQSQWMPADWMLAFNSDKPFLPWQYINPAFTVGAVFDYDGALGKLALYLADIQNTLEVAKQIGAPGIALDLEFYSNYDWNTIATGAGLAGISEADYKTALQAIGVQIAGVINASFPTATIWGIQCSISASRVIYSDYWITLGILSALASTVTFIASGEGEIGYFHTTVVDYTNDADGFINNTVGVVQNDATNVQLGAPLQVWQDENDTDLFVATWIAANPAQPFSVLEDFRPAANILFNKFKYIWVYNCPQATGWDSIGAEAAPVNAFLQSVKNGQPS